MHESIAISIKEEEARKLAIQDGKFAVFHCIENAVYFGTVVCTIHVTASSIHIIR
jgi:hypothetical protein